MTFIGDAAAIGAGDMSSVYASREAADAHVADAGGLPEIARASQDLMTAFDLTRQQIANATFAGRFGTDPEAFIHGLENRGSTINQFSHAIAAAGLKGGEAEVKREQLAIRLQALEGSLLGLLVDLVGLRADLEFSQREFVDEVAPEKEA